MGLRPGNEPDNAEWESISIMLPRALIALGAIGLFVLGAGIMQKSWGKGIAGLIMMIPVIALFCLYKYFKKTMSKHYN